MLTGDGSAAVKSKDGTYSETYVCPQGFAGKYRILVQRAWGEVGAGKVTVDVLTDFGTSEESYNRKQIALDDKDALLELEVKTGHRSEPIVEAQIAKAEMRRVAAGRTVLAQTSGESRSSGGMSMAEFWARQQALLAAQSRGFPFRGAVGYRPQLTVLPDGVSMFPNAVISGDRRYVRVTPNPQFNTIIEVRTFNFITGGSTTQGGGGTNGGGGGFGGGGFGGGLQ